MKRLLKACLSRAVSNDRVWSLLNATIMQTSRFLEWERSKNQLDPLELERQDVIQQQCSDLVVRHGPFQNMRFPTPEAATGSSHRKQPPEAATGSLLPKLLGTYEMELHPVFEAIRSNSYGQVLNIGAGEGYYAVGLALRWPQLRVFAYDTNPLANRQCESMAQLNGVADRIICKSTYTRDMLMTLATAERTLLICDCEGYEKQLFDRESVQALKKHDVLVEIHDFVDIGISRQLTDAFIPTHNLTAISAIGNIKRALLCSLPELEAYPIEQRVRLLSEDRNHEMEWFWLTPK